MRISMSCTAILAYVVVGHPPPAAAQVDQQRAQEYFKEAQALCERDGGKLWGISLCGPMVFTDAATKTIATSQPAPDGPRPGGLGFLNAPVTWAGARWSAYMWAFISPTDAQARGRLFIHELFHRIQPELKLLAGVGETPHLDALEGRYWLQLEWRALSRALSSSGAARAAAISDALAFRRARQAAFPGASAAEAADEIREGLAEYTAVVVAVPSNADAIAAAVRQLVTVAQEASFVRRFHAASGPAYGLLLDSFAPGWPRRVTAADDLAQMLTTAAKIEPAADAVAAASRYRGAELRVAEEQRDREQQAIIAELRRRYVDGPVLIVPRAGSGPTNNMGATVIPGAGTVFRSMANKGAWGFFDAKGGALVSADEETISLPAPVVVDATTLKGDGWTATVGPGWTVQPGPRPGSFRVVRQ